MTYRRFQATQDDVNHLVNMIRVALEGMNMTVAPNGYGYRIECNVCHWSKCHGPVTEAMAHADTHAA